MPTPLQYPLTILLLLVLHLCSASASQFLLWDGVGQYLQALHLNHWWLKAPYLLYLCLAAAMILVMAILWVFNQKLPLRWVKMWPYVYMPVLLLLLLLSILSLFLWLFTLPSLLFALYLYHWHQNTPPLTLAHTEE